MWVAMFFFLSAEWHGDHACFVRRSNMTEDPPYWSRGRRRRRGSIRPRRLASRLSSLRCPPCSSGEVARPRRACGSAGEAGDRGQLPSPGRVAHGPRQPEVVCGLLFGPSAPGAPALALGAPELALQLRHRGRQSLLGGRLVRLDFARS
ncbi:unnamed protein product [Prorocentrum cordatum]|uniref:Secreted protein n=1 Tax=Prorocentrum cordatum TaxID=2364126 RepID=A0ABN9VCR9_9DINO|nr:unnamed protein product [Polarella glacialis]